MRLRGLFQSHKGSASKNVWGNAGVQYASLHYHKWMITVEPTRKGHALTGEYIGSNRRAWKKSMFK